MHASLFDEIDRTITAEEIETLEKIFTSEFSVIYHALSWINNIYKSVPSSRRKSSRRDYFMNEVIQIVLPPIYINYIMFFSAMTDDELTQI